MKRGLSADDAAYTATVTYADGTTDGGLFGSFAAARSWCDRLRRYLDTDARHGAITCAEVYNHRTGNIRRASIRTFGLEWES